MSLADYRNEYGKYQLPDKDLLSDPKEQFHKWLKQAMANDAPEPTAMTLSTVNKDGQPTARIVLLKGYDDNGLCFYRNYESRKVQELVHNNKACLSFFWPTMQRQVRFEGQSYAFHTAIRKLISAAALCPQKSTPGPRHRASPSALMIYANAVSITHR